MEKTPISQEEILCRRLLRTSSKEHAERILNEHPCQNYKQVIDSLHSHALDLIHEGNHERAADLKRAADLIGISLSIAEDKVQALVPLCYLYEFYVSKNRGSSQSDWVVGEVLKKPINDMPKLFAHAMSKCDDIEKAKWYVECIGKFYKDKNQLDVATNLVTDIVHELSDLLNVAFQDLAFLLDVVEDARLNVETGSIEAIESIIESISEERNLSSPEDLQIKSLQREGVKLYKEACQCRDDEKWHEAKENCLASLEIQRNLLQISHDHLKQTTQEIILNDLDFLTEICLKLKQYEEALSFCTEAVDMKEDMYNQTLHPSHQKVRRLLIWSYNCLKEIYSKLGDTYSVKEAEKKSFAVQTRLTPEMASIQFEADNLYRNAIQHKDNGDLVKSKDCCLSALEIQNQLLQIVEPQFSVRYKRDILGSLDFLTDICFQQQDYENSLKFCNEGIEKKKDWLDSIIQEEGKQKEVEINGRISWGYDYLGRIYFKRGSLRPAEEAFREAFRLRKRIDDMELQARTLDNLVQVYLAKGDSEKAESICKLLIDLWQRLLEQSGKVKYVEPLAHIYIYWMGDINNAIALLTQFQERYNELKRQGLDSMTQTEYARTMHNLGRICFAKICSLKAPNEHPLFEQAQTMFEQALYANQEIGNVVGQMQNLCMLSQLAARQGSYSQALEFSIEALTYVAETENLLSQCEFLTNTTELFLNLHKRTPAATLDIVNSKYPEIAMAYSQISIDGSDISEIKDSLESADENCPLYFCLQLATLAVAISQKAGAITIQMEAIEKLASVYAALGEFDKAIENYDMAIDVLKDTQEFLLMGKLCFKKGRILERLGADENLVLQAYHKSIESFEKVRFSHLSESDRRTNFSAYLLGTYNRVTNIQYKMGEYTEAFMNLEHTKGRTLIESLAEGEGYERELQDDPDQSLEIDIGHQGPESVEQDLEQSFLTSPTSRWSHEQFTRIGSLYEIQESLDNDTVLIEYGNLKDALLVFLISRQEGIFKSCELPTDDIEHEIKYFIETINNICDTNSEEEEEEFELYNRDLMQYLSSFYRQLLEPFIPDIKVRGFSKLLIVSHGGLHHLPFHAFYDGNRYLLDDFEVLYSPSGSIFKTVKDKSCITKDGCLVVGANPNSYLNHIEDEVTAVKAQFTSDHIKVLLHNQATVDNVLTELTKKTYDIIHFASHARFNRHNPPYSYILLEAGNSQQESEITASDGKLYLKDIDNLYFSPTLIVVSACESGRSNVLEGEELIGLPRAFLCSGASAVLSSLWEVDDGATKLLMEYFYQAWIGNGVSKSSALRQAALIVRNYVGNLSANNNYYSPYYWAPFVLMGDYR